MATVQKDILAGRIRRIRRALIERKLDALLMTNPANVTYVTGFRGADSWALATQRQVYLLTDSRYTEQARKECSACRIVERKESLAQDVARIVRRSASIYTIGVEKHTSLGSYESLKKRVDRRLRPVDGITQAVRRIKDAGEIRAIRTSAAISRKVLERTLEYIQAGISEMELAGLLDLEMRRNNAVTSFETIVAFGANGSRPHHQPGARRLRRTDTVLIDFGAKRDGYCSDITRCFAVGKATRLYREVFEAVERAQAAAIGKIKPGARLADVDEAAREVIREADLPVYGHGTGHGFGLEIHEEPFLKPGAKGVLEEGTVLTIEPGVYMPGTLGVRIEDDVLVTDNGCEVLTRRCPHALAPGC